MATTAEQAVRLERRRFTPAEYHRMAELGVLAEDERVELIEGEIVRMSAKGSRHNGCVIALDDELRSRGVQLNAPTWRPVVSVQNSVQLGDSEPEPDLAVLRARADRYRNELPSASDILLLIEVADTSLAYDRAVKLPLYARAGVPEAWLVDLGGERIERHTQPSPDGYRRVAIFGRGEVVGSEVLPSLALPADVVLG